MIRPRRPALLAAFVLALLLPAAGARALDQAALEELETLLRDLGFDPGAVDGVVDADTTAAIERYQAFALLPGPPEPTAQLLDELRGVAAAYSALGAGGAPEAPMESAPPPVAADPDKAVVPPAPPPPKLTAEIAPDAQIEAEVGPDIEAAADVSPPEEPLPPDAVAALPPVVEQVPAEEAPSAEAPADVLRPVAPAVATLAPPPTEADELLQTSVEAALEPFHPQLADGSLTRKDLARQFNKEGRDLLQQADYQGAILKFSVAIRLDPDFAGAYSNRGTAYRLQDETDRAEADFAKAKELGFGGFRLKDAKNPLR